MARTPSTMLAVGTHLPEFRLADTDGSSVSSKDFAGKPLLVMFICNHCPFVLHVQKELVKLGVDYPAAKLGIVAISSNDPEEYPADAPDKMAEEKKRVGYRFPYLFDATQDVAKAFRAACTPDFYLFDSQHKLVYRGQLDDSRPSNGVPVTGKDLRAAIEAVLSSQDVPVQQKPSLGCNIKWRTPPAYT